jgi:hypothetical protein
MKTFSLAAFLALLLAPLAAAQDVSSLLDQAAQVEAGKHAAWIAVRDQIVSKGQSAVPDLKEAAAESNWTAQGWVRAMAAEACRLRIENPQAASTVDNPPGINPERYLKFRKPAPMCNRDFNFLPKDAVPLMLERFRWTLEKQNFSEGEAGIAERNALATALLHAPGHHADVRARFAMEAAMKDSALPDDWRQEAAVSFGKTGGVDAIKTLCATVDSTTQPIAVREAAAWAIGRVADKGAYTALQSRLGNTELTGGQHGNQLVRALINGVGILGARGGWDSRGPMMAATGEQIRDDCARLLVDQLKAHPGEAALIRDQLSIVALERSLDWVKALAIDGETAAIRNAAQSCVDPLTLTLSRYK